MRKKHKNPLYLGPAEHVQQCAEPKEMRVRHGGCLNCGDAVTYSQTTCPHAVMLDGTCDCGANADRAGWINEEES